MVAKPLSLFPMLSSYVVLMWLIISDVTTTLFVFHMEVRRKNWTRVQYGNLTGGLFSDLG